MKIGIAAGTYSLVTYGHVKYFEECKKHCDYLVVLIGGDNKVWAKKGCVPMPDDERMGIVQALKCVDEVHIFVSSTEDTFVQSYIDRDENWDSTSQESYKYCNEYVVFHSSERKAEKEQGKKVPCEDMAEIIFIDDFPTTKVSQIFETIRKGDG